MPKFIIEYLNSEKHRIWDFTLFQIDADSKEDAVGKFIDFPDSSRVLLDIMRLICWREYNYIFPSTYPLTFKKLKKHYMVDEFDDQKIAKKYIKRYRKRIFNFLMNGVPSTIFDVTEAKDGFFADPHRA